MKKFLALVLAVMMIMTVAAASADGVTISFFDKNSGTKTFDDPVAVELMKRTGVTIDLQQPTGDPGEKLSLMLAGLNYPDIVLMDRSSDIVNQYIEAGALVDLSQYFDLMPNVVAMYGETLNKTRYAVEGEYYGGNYYLSNWYGYDPDPMNGFICRYDYMIDMVGQERADSDEPFTYSEFVQLLKDWKAKYPQIDGQDTIPVVLAQPGSGSINGVFSGMNGMYPYYVDENKNVSLTVSDPKFLDAIHQMNELYREGLMDVEWTSNSSELMNQKLSQNNVFCLAGAYWDADTASDALQAATGNENAEYLAYKVVADDVDPDKTTLCGRSSLGWDAIGVTTNCENIEEVCKFIDYCASQEGQDLLLWGIEGQDWEMKDGVHTAIGDIVERWQADASNVQNDTGICKWTWFVKNGNHDDGTNRRIWYNTQTRSTKYAYQNLTNTYYDSALYAGLEPSGSTIEALEYQRCIDLFNTAYPKMVNAASQEECDAVYAQLLLDLQDAGVEDVQAYITAAYQARVELWGLDQ